MKYLSIFAVFCLIAIVAAGTRQDDSLLINKDLLRGRVKRQSTGFSSSSSSSSSSSTGGNGKPGTFEHSSTSFQSVSAPGGVNLADRFGGDDGNTVNTGHVSHVAGTFDPATGQANVHTNYFQQFPNNFQSNTNYRPNQ